MLQSHKKDQPPLHSHGFLVFVEAEEGTDRHFIEGKLKDSLTWVEGIGEVNVEYIGNMDEQGGVNDEAGTD